MMLRVWRVQQPSRQSLLLRLTGHPFSPRGPSLVAMLLPAAHQGRRRGWPQQWRQPLMLPLLPSPPPLPQALRTLETFAFPD
jgi:hypothetical protein